MITILPANLNRDLARFNYNSSAENGDYFQIFEKAYAATSLSGNEIYNYEPYLSLSGSNYTGIPSSQSLQLTKFTLETWFYTSQIVPSGEKAFIVNKGGIGTDASHKNLNYGIWMDSEGKIAAGFETTTGADRFVQSPTSVNDGKWHQIILTYGGSALVLYLDGSQVSSMPTSAIPDAGGSQPFRIGANSLAIESFFKGKVDEIRIWNRPLSREEVSDAYYNRFPNEDGLVAYLPFGSTSLVGTFYYPWMGGKNSPQPNTYKHWHDYSDPPRTWSSHYLPDMDPSKFDPTNELYDANDPKIVKKQFDWMRKAGVQFVISSWWGKYEYTDLALQNIFHNILPASDNPYPNIKFTIYYEKDSLRNVPSTEIISDINYIKTKYASSPYFLKINGKPVIFVYNTGHGETLLQEAQKWNEVKRQTGIYLVLKVFNNYKDNLRLADGWHQYAPSKRYDEQEGWSAMVSPGFWKYDENPRLSRESFGSFETAVQKMAAADVKFKLIETWNEWSEGTGVEPAQRVIRDMTNGFKPAAASYGEQYITILGKYLNK